MKRLLQELPRRLLWMCAGYGVTQLLGIPLVGGMVARVLDGIAFGASTTADYIRYVNVQEANKIIRHQLNQGATLEKFYHNDDGSVAVQYDISAYTGEEIEADTLEALSEWM